MSELKLFHTKNTYTFPDKDITVASQEDVGSLDQQLREEIDDIKSFMLFPWTDVISFTYNGSNNIHTVSFIPNSVGYAILNGVSLNPYVDYKYEEDTVVLDTKLLTEDIEYVLVIQYFK